MYVGARVGTIHFRKALGYIVPIKKPRVPRFRNLPVLGKNRTLKNDRTHVRTYCLLRYRTIYRMRDCFISLLFRLFLFGQILVLVWSSRELFELRVSEQLRAPLTRHAWQSWSSGAVDERFPYNGT